VIRLEGGINTNPGAGGAWVWTPVIEYNADGQRFSSQFSYWQLFNAKPRYAVGDEVKILYSPRDPSRFELDAWHSWLTHLTISILLGSAITSAIAVRNPGP
jgi:hypothetical protein